MYTRGRLCVCVCESKHWHFDEERSSSSSKKAVTDDGDEYDEGIQGRKRNGKTDIGWLWSDISWSVLAAFERTGQVKLSEKHRHSVLLILSFSPYSVQRLDRTQNSVKVKISGTLFDYI